MIYAQLSLATHQNQRAIGSTTVDVVPSPTVLCTETRKRAFAALDQIFDDGKSQPRAGDAVLFDIAGTLELSVPYEPFNSPDVPHLQSSVCEAQTGLK